MQNKYPLIIIIWLLLFSCFAIVYQYLKYEANSNKFPLTNDVKQITIYQPQQTLIFTKENNHWMLNDGNKYDNVDEQRIAELLSALKDGCVARYLTNEIAITDDKLLSFAIDNKRYYINKMQAFDNKNYIYDKNYTFLCHELIKIIMLLPQKQWLKIENNTGDYDARTSGS